MNMDILYVTNFMNGFLMIAMPVALAIYLTRRWKLGWRFWFVGAAVFILSQIGHIPFLYGLTALFTNHVLPNPPAEWKDVFNAVLLGLLAGLFEELARYAMFRWWLKDARSWRKGVLAGAGHGGAEAISLGVIVLLAYLNLVILRNPANLASVPAAQLDTVTSQVAAYWSHALVYLVDGCAGTVPHYSGADLFFGHCPSDLYAQKMVLGVAGRAFSCDCRYYRCPGCTCVGDLLDGGDRGGFFRAECVDHLPVAPARARGA
jgi:hypothetical protein